MKKMVLILTSVILAASLSAAKLPIQNGRHGFQIQAQKSNSLELEYTVRDLDINKVATEKGEFTAIHMPNGYLTNKVGAPAEPEFHNLIELPLGATPEVEIISYDSKTIDITAAGYKAPLMPAQPSYAKDVNPSEIYTHYNPSSYKVDRFSDDKIATATVSGNSRGRTIVYLSVRTTKYNPSSNKLTVLNNIKVRVKFKGGVTNPAETVAAHYSPYFDDNYIINPTPKTDYNDLVKSPVTYLLVANSGLQNNSKLDEFIQWKTEKGFNVITKFVSATTPISGSGSIDEWIETQYNTLTPKPSFVLIVGDESGTYGVKSEVNPPLGSTGGVTRSDLLYGVIGSVSTTNHIPSMYVGRFSVRDLADLDAQVNKTIYYEKTQFTSNADLSYLAKAMVVAGEDVDNEVKYGNPHVRYAMAYHYNNTYTNPVTNTTNGITGIPSTSDNTLAASTIISNVSQGLAYYNYTAHGSETSFGDPAFSISSINSLSNSGKYGLIIGNCCLTGSFGTTECFGEAWLNAPNKGSIGYIGSSMSTLWDEDLAMGIGSESTGDVNHAGTNVNYIPPFTPNAPGMPDGLMLMKFPTQAGIKHVGLLAVETYGGDYRDNYWSAYHLFGDPSIMIYAGVPKVMEVAHAPTIPVGATTYTVSAVKNAYVALSDEAGVLHGAGIANESGVATVTITPFTTGYAKLVVYAPMKKPVFHNIQAGNVGDPSVAITSPSNNEVIITGTIVNIAATASDPAKSVSKVEFYIDNILKSTDSSAPYEYIWNTSGYTLSAHAIKAVVTDNQNNTNQHNISVNVANAQINIFSESFDGTWTTPSTLLTNSAPWSGTTDAVNEWHKNNYTTGWLYPSGTSSSTGANTTPNYARFHSYGVESSVGEVSLITPAIDLSSTVAGSDSLTFQYINLTGNDVLKVYVSTNNGTSYSAALATCETAETWTKQAIALGDVNNSQVKIKFGATSDYGDDDIGLDEVKVNGVLASVVSESLKPSQTELFQNYPNPFNPETTIKFYNKETANVKLAIYNLKGEVVANLVNNNLSQGFHDYRFDATDLASGVYIYKLQIGNQSMVKSMLLLK